jgi:hypothetical protein
VFIIHEEIVNQLLRIVYFGGVLNGEEVSVRAIDYIPNYIYLVKAIVDVAGYWKLRGFSRFFVVHFILSYIS